MHFILFYKYFDFFIIIITVVIAPYWHKHGASSMFMVI